MEYTGIKNSIILQMDTSMLDVDLYLNRKRLQKVAYITAIDNWVQEKVVVSYVIVGM